MAPEPQKSNHRTLLLVAIIGVVGAVSAATINVIGNYNVEKSRQAAELTRIALMSTLTQKNIESTPTSTPTSNTVSSSTPTPTQIAIAQPLTVFFDSFDGSNGSYDTNLWACASECSAENIFIQNGVLNIRRDNIGLTYILSNSTWEYSDLSSLTGKIKINSKLNQWEFTWLSLHDNLIDCTVAAEESPSIYCEVGTTTRGTQEYVISVPIEYDTWYSVKLEFDHIHNTVNFFVDDNMIGEYTLTKYPGTVQISLGLYSTNNNPLGQVYFDDIKLTSN